MWMTPMQKTNMKKVTVITVTIMWMTIVKALIWMMTMICLTYGQKTSDQKRKGLSTKPGWKISPKKTKTTKATTLWKSKVKGNPVSHHPHVRVPLRKTDYMLLVMNL